MKINPLSPSRLDLPTIQTDFTTNQLTLEQSEAELRAKVTDLIKQGNGLDDTIQDILVTLTGMVTQKVLREVNKLDMTNFTGSWHGVAKPSLTNEGLPGSVERLEEVKQDKTDSSLVTESKEIVGAINESKEIIDENSKKVTNIFNPMMFGAKGDGVTDDSEALQRCIDFVSTLVVPMEIKYNSKSIGEKVIDLVGKQYLIKKPINISTTDQRISNINTINGVIIADKSSMIDQDMVSIGGFAHVRGVKFSHVIFDGNNVAHAPHVNIYCLHTIFSKCSFINISKELYIHPVQTHETIIEDCYFDNSRIDGEFKCENALSIGIDTTVKDNNLIGFKNGIDVNGGCNTIVGNHIYSISDWGMRFRTGSTQCSVNHNYLDGCSIYVESDYTYHTFNNNIFLVPLKSSGIIINGTGRGMSVNGNTYSFTEEKQNKLKGVTGTLTLSTCTLEVQGVTLDSNDVGYCNQEKTLCITEILDETHCKVAYNSDYIKQDITGKFWFYPTNVSTALSNSNLDLRYDFSNEIVKGGINDLTKPKIFKCPVKEGLQGTLNIVLKDEIVYLSSYGLYTSENPNTKTSIAVATLPDRYRSAIPITGVAMATNANTGDVLGVCQYSLTGTDLVIKKKQGDFNTNNVSFEFNLQYQRYIG